MQGIQDAPDLTLQIVATGMHLSPIAHFWFILTDTSIRLLNREIDNLNIKRA